MLPGRATTKVGTSADEDLSLGVRFTIEDEISVFTSSRVFSKGEEKGVCETGTLESLQELLGNDHVGVNILDVQRSCDSLDDCEFLDT